MAYQIKNLDGHHVVICRTREMIKRFVDHTAFNLDGNRIEIVVCDSEDFFVKRDPYKYVAIHQVIVVLAKYARGLHISHREYSPLNVIIDHLPEDKHLLKQYYSIGSRR